MKRTSNILVLACLLLPRQFRVPSRHLPCFYREEKITVLRRVDFERCSSKRSVLDHLSTALLSTKFYCLFFETLVIKVHTWTDPLRVTVTPSIGFIASLSRVLLSFPLLQYHLIYNVNVFAFYNHAGCYRRAWYNMYDRKTLPAHTARCRKMWKSASKHHATTGDNVVLLFHQPLLVLEDSIQ